MKLQSFVDRFRDSDVLGDLDVEETKAFVDLLILSVLVDGTITEQELDGLADQWSQMPFAGDETLETLVGEHGSETRAYLEVHAQDPNKVSEFLDKAAARLERPAVQEAAVRMVAVVSEADGLAETERKLCRDLGARFGMSHERVDEILDEMTPAS